MSRAIDDGLKHGATEKVSTELHEANKQIRLLEFEAEEEMILRKC